MSPAGCARYYQHRVDRTIPIEETWKALAELVKEGKVKYLGKALCPAASQQWHASQPANERPARRHL